MVVFVILVAFVPASVDMADAIRSGCPARQPSPINVPGPRAAIRPSLPCSDSADTWTLPCVT